MRDVVTALDLGLASAEFVTQEGRTNRDNGCNVVLRFSEQLIKNSWQC